MKIAKFFIAHRQATWLRMAILSFVALATAGGVAVPAVAQSILGSGAGLTVTEQDLQAAAELIPLTARGTILSRPENVTKQVEVIFVRRELTREAIADGLDKEPVVIALLQQARERILSDVKLAAQDLSVTPADAVLESYAQEAYKADPQRFNQIAQTRVRHILIRNSGPESKKRAEELLTKIRGGALFETVAKLESDDLESGVNGGDLGYFGEGKMVKPFEDAVAALTNPGDVSNIVETEFGYHLIKLEARRPAGILPYPEVREALRKEARDRAQREARTSKFDKLLQELKTEPSAIEAFSAKYRK